MQIMQRRQREQLQSFAMAYFQISMSFLNHSTCFDPIQAGTNHVQKFAERRQPDVAFCDIESLISAPTKSPVDQKERHGSKGSYLSVDTADGEEEVLGEECTWLDEAVTSVPAQDSAFEVEAEVDIHAPIATRILSDKRESVAGQALANDGSSSDGPTDLEDVNGEWPAQVVESSGEIFEFWSHDC
ncbi:hypothetical protein P692DRAFT_20956597 [Suillus brevipes Sb2]|nr:hypothetical protein P692DRAFT_20956597 [Suillus brevipes Sb2]